MQNQDENFETLRRALKLKRHEQPPPGFYKGFSRHVISRIQENDVHDRRRAMDAVEWEAPWMSRILGFFQTKPAFAGILGTAVCVLMIGGIIYSERPSMPGTAEGNRLGTAQNMTGVGLAGSATEGPLMDSGAGPLGALPPGTTLFDRLPAYQGTLQLSRTTTNLTK